MVVLPNEYQEVEYIESTGTQCIDLPFGFDQTDEVEAKFSIDISHLNDKYIVSPVSWNTDNNRFAMGVHSGTSTLGAGYYTVGYGKNSTPTTRFSPLTLNDGKIHDWQYKNYVFAVSDVGRSKNVSSIMFGSTTANLRLFYGYNAKTKGKISSYRHKKVNGTEINLIPCYRKSDNEIGMYDLVSGTFYTNSGTGTFKKGYDVNRDIPSLLDIRRHILLNTPHAELLTGTSVTFNTDMKAPLKECKVYFTPVQEGEGTPSLENVRPIHGWDGITVTHFGDNLYEYTPANDGYYISGTGKVSRDGDSATTYSALIPVEPGATYVYHCIPEPSVNKVTNRRIHGYNSAGEWVQQIINVAVPANTEASYSADGTFVIPSNVPFIRISIRLLDIDTYVKKPVPYEIQFPQTIYGGYVDLISGEVVETEYAYNFATETPIWASPLANPDNQYFAPSPNMQKGYLTINDRTFCNKLNKVVNKTLGAGIRFGADNNSIYIYNMTEIEGIEAGIDVRNWLKDNSVVIVYPLAEPITHSLTPQQINTLHGINNFTTNANGNVEVKYWTH